MITRMHLTQAERDLIVELCRAALLHNRGESAAAQDTYNEMAADDWQRVESIILKLDQADPDLYPDYS